jgi:hypothetical protein
MPFAKLGMLKRWEVVVGCGIRSSIRIWGSGYIFWVMREEGVGS